MWLWYSPLIKKLDAGAFAKLVECEHLALSTNAVRWMMRIFFFSISIFAVFPLIQIDKMESFGQMPKLKILSIGRYSTLSTHYSTHASSIFIVMHKTTLTATHSHAIYPIAAKEPN